MRVAEQPCPAAVHYDMNWRKGLAILSLGVLSIGVLTVFGMGYRVLVALFDTSDLAVVLFCVWWGALFVALWLAARHSPNNPA